MKSICVSPDVHVVGLETTTERMSMSGMDSDILQYYNASLCAAIQSDVAAFLEGLPRLNADAPAFLPSSQQQVSVHDSKREKNIWAPDISTKNTKT